MKARWNSVGSQRLGATCRTTTKCRITAKECGAQGKQDKKKCDKNKMGINYAYGQELRLKMKESEGGMRGNRCKMRENIVEE